MSQENNTPLTLREKLFFTALIAACNLLIGLSLWQMITPGR